MFSLNLDNSETADESELYDVVIVGAGSAGFTTAIYSSRDSWKTLILEKEASGGLAATTHSIENYPGFPKGVEGPVLMENFQKQAERFGAVLEEFDGVKSISKGDDGVFIIETDAGKSYRGRTVLLATGSEPKKLDIPGEAEFYNKGVSYCATCDGPLYKDEEVVVIGCGNSGLQEAQILLEYAKKVTFVEFLDLSIAEQVLQDRVKSHEKTVCKFSHMATEVKGENLVKSLVVKNRETEELIEIPAAAIFIYVGYKPYTSFVEGLVDLDDYGYIVADKYMKTSVPGIFAAGDVVSENLAQVAVAVGDGAKAAVAIREYLQNL
mgnify:CR=1 FL=1